MEQIDFESAREIIRNIGRENRQQIMEIMYNNIKVQDRYRAVNMWNQLEQNNYLFEDEIENTFLQIQMNVMYSAHQTAV